MHVIGGETDGNLKNPARPVKGNIAYSESRPVLKPGSIRRTKSLVNRLA